MNLPLISGRLVLSQRLVIHRVSIPRTLLRERKTLLLPTMILIYSIFKF